MRRRPWSIGICLVLPLIAAGTPAAAATQAMLQVDAEGRANAKRNRLVLINKAADGRDVMLVLSCRVEDARTYGAALDFGNGGGWEIEGEQVTISRDNGPDIVQRMDSRDEYLALGGEPAIKLFRTLLAGKTMAFAVRKRFTASFDLGDVARHVSRFKELCDPR